MKNQCGRLQAGFLTVLAHHPLQAGLRLQHLAAGNGGGVAVAGGDVKLPQPLGVACNAHFRFPVKNLLRRIRRADAEARRADVQAERAEGLQRQLWTENIVLDNSLVMTVSVDKAGDIRLETEGAGTVLIDYDWDDDTYAYNRLRGLLLDKLKSTDREAAFLVFQYDRARVYHAEYDMIERIVQEVKGEARDRDIPLSVLELDIHEG